MQPRVEPTSTTWERVRRFGALFVPERYRRCKFCNRKFSTGILVIDHGYSHDAVCEECCQEGRHEELS